MPEHNPFLSTKITRMNVDDEVNKKGCKMEYDKLQECLDTHNRNWVMCQVDVKEWKKCFEMQKTEAVIAKQTSAEKQP